MFIITETILSVFVLGLQLGMIINWLMAYLVDKYYVPKIIKKKLEEE